MQAEPVQPSREETVEEPAADAPTTEPEPEPSQEATEAPTEQVWYRRKQEDVSCISQWFGDQMKGLLKPSHRLLLEDWRFQGGSDLAFFNSGWDAAAALCVCIASSAVMDRQSVCIVLMTFICDVAEHWQLEAN